MIIFSRMIYDLFRGGFVYAWRDEKRKAANYASEKTTRGGNRTKVDITSHEQTSVLPRNSPTGVTLLLLLLILYPLARFNGYIYVTRSLQSVWLLFDVPVYPDFGFLETLQGAVTLSKINTTWRFNVQSKKCTQCWRRFQRRTITTDGWSLFI